MSNDSTRKPDPLSPDSILDLLKPSPLADLFKPSPLADLFKPSPLADLFKPSPLDKLFESERLVAAQYEELNANLRKHLDAENRRREHVATPAVAPIPPEPTAKGGAAKKRAALLALLDEIDKRAAEQGADFNRHSLPGTKKEFHALAIKYNNRAFSKALSTFDDYLQGQCQFESGGVKPEQGKGAAIWALFPEYKPKLG